MSVGMEEITLKMERSMKMFTVKAMRALKKQLSISKFFRTLEIKQKHAAGSIFSRKMDKQQ